jgi:hypothetical protein
MCCTEVIKNLFTIFGEQKAFSFYKGKQVQSMEHCRKNHCSRGVVQLCFWRFWFIDNERLISCGQFNTTMTKFNSQ